MIILEEGTKGERPNWDEYFMAAAIVIASRATCFNVHAGAVVTLDNRIIGTGYNGAAPGIKNCLNNGRCIKEKRTGKSYEEEMNSGNCIGVHSEMNALAHLNRLTHRGITLYNTIFPCTACAKSLLAFSIDRIVFKRGYDKRESELACSLFEERGVQVCQLDLSPKRYLDIAFNHPGVKFDVWDSQDRRS